MADTMYLVFRKNGDGTFAELGATAAGSPKAAIAALVDEMAKGTGEPVDGKFAATPVRNWTELPVGVEVVTRIKVG